MPTEKPKGHGRRWRLRAYGDAAGRPFEVENLGTFDELVVDDWLHIEQMDSRVWWLRVGDARLMVTVGGVTPTVDVERGVYSETRGATKEAGAREPERGDPDES